MRFLLLALFVDISYTATATAASVAATSNAKSEKPVGATSSMPTADYAQCISDLSAKKFEFEAAGAVKEGACQLSGAIRLATVPSAFGKVVISGRPTMMCNFGRQFGKWVSEVGAPMTFAYSGQKLATIEIASAFSCRARYDKSGGVPSEHAKGDAIDVAAFVLNDGRRILVKQQASDMDRDLVRGLRTTACGYFTTVLGPGTDAAHAEHFHFDTGIHGGQPNYRICE